MNDPLSALFLPVKRASGPSRMTLGVCLLTIAIAFYSAIAEAQLSRQCCPPMAKSLLEGPVMSEDPPWNSSLTGSLWTQIATNSAKALSKATDWANSNPCPISCLPVDDYDIELHTHHYGYAHNDPICSSRDFGETRMVSSSSPISCIPAYISVANTIREYEGNLGQACGSGCSAQGISSNVINVAESRSSIMCTVSITFRVEVHCDKDQANDKTGMGAQWATWSEVFAVRRCYAAISEESEDPVLIDY